MADAPGAVLVAEIGSLITRVTLVDDVDGEYRLVGHAETSSSIELPYQNALYGILEAAAQISELTGRPLLRDGQLIMPQRSEGDGVNQLVAVTSATGPMSLVIAALAGQFSGHSALRASRATYTALLQTFTLDDAADQASRSASEQSWTERQVERLLYLRPDAVLISGGLEHGAVEAVVRLAQIVRLTGLGAAVDAQGQRRQDPAARPVIYAGNSAAREQVRAALAEHAEVFVVDNLRPTLEREQLDPTRQQLARLYEQQILPRLPGLGALQRMGRAPVRTVCDVEGLLTRFLAERTGRRVVTVDVGASASAIFYATPGRFHPAVLGTVGTVYGLAELLATRGVAAIARWLPFACEEAALTERLLNRLLRPQTLPASREDLYIEHALVREVLRAVREALQDEVATDDYDWLLASGGVLGHAPEPGHALLMLLDGLEPCGEHDHPIVDIYLDTLGLLPASGALAGHDPEAALTLIDRDLLRNTPLAAVVVLLGEGRAGETAAEVELATVGGATERLVVRHGELARLALPPGRYGRLKVQPRPGVRIGAAAPGEAVASEGGDVTGSVLGVVIDARGRPLPLPADDAQRQARLWEWLVALGAETGASPFAAQEPRAVTAAQATAAPQAGDAAETLAGDDVTQAVVATQQPAREEPVSEPAPLVGADEVSAEAPAGRRIALDALPPEEPARPVSPPQQIESELDALRQTVEAPKKRGLFGRKQ